MMVSGGFERRRRGRIAIIAAASGFGKKHLSVAFRFVPVLGVMALAMLGAQPAWGQGNSPAAHWCAVNFPPGQRGQCVSQAAQGTGPFFACGPGGTNVGLCGGVGGVCCGAGKVCAANACATPTPTSTRTFTPTPTATRTPTSTSTKTLTATRTPTATPTVPPGPPPPADCGDPAQAPFALAAGSIAIYPKIIADGSRDTVIQLTNTGNPASQVHCFYVDGKTCQVTNFSLALTGQQPTQWVASQGRIANPTPGPDPGIVPPLSVPFAGELKCVQVDFTGLPIAQNSLTGSATLLGPDGDVSKYDAITIPGFQSSPNSALQLDDVQYGACPRELRFTHIAEGAANPALPGSVVTNDLTLVPCTEDLTTGGGATVPVSFRFVDELELRLSASTTFTCWADVALGSLLPPAVSHFDYTRVTTTSTCHGGPNDGRSCTNDADCPVGLCAANPVLGVLETTHTVSTCRGDALAGRPCTSDADCPGGLCAVNPAREARNLQVCGSGPGATIILPPPQ